MILHLMRIFDPYVFLFFEIFIFLLGISLGMSHRMEELRYVDFGFSKERDLLINTGYISLFSSYL